MAWPNDRDRGEPEGVAVLRWPAEAERRDVLAAKNHPRLLLVDPGCAPPLVVAAGEDWIRVPADERDMYARLSRLQRNHERRSSTPSLDQDIIRFDGRSAVLSPFEAVIVAVLLEDFGHLVSRDRIVAALWEDGTEHSLNSRLHRLRKRVAHVGLNVTSIRGRGFILEPFDPEDEP